MYGQRKAVVGQRSTVSTIVAVVVALFCAGSAYGQGAGAYLVGPTVTPTRPSAHVQGEEHVAVDPTNAQNLFAAVMDGGLMRLGQYLPTIKLAFSSDNGTTWKDGYVPLDVNGFPIAADGSSWTVNSDPVVAIDGKVNAFFTAIYLNVQNNAQGIYVGATSLNGLKKLGAGGGFTAAQVRPVLALLDPNTQVLLDKPWITVDTSGNPDTSGNVYVSFTIGSKNFNQHAIVVARSTDHGMTWSAPVTLGIDNAGGRVQNSHVAVGPKGELYVSYESHNWSGNAALFLTKSTDGGLTFSAPSQITANFNVPTFKSTYRYFDLHQMAVSPADGNVYLTFAGQPTNQAGAEAEFIRSTDGGATFSAPLAMNDVTAGQQFMPAITVDSAGVIHACWLDTRNSPDDSSFHDIYATFSTDDGLTFAPNARVTRSTIGTDSCWWIGDYIGIAADGGVAHPVWNTGGAPGVGSLQTATLTLP